MTANTLSKVIARIAKEDSKTIAKAELNLAGEVLQDSIPILLWGGPIEYSFSIANSWKPVGKRVTVTEAEGRQVKRIGDYKAVDFYRYYLGDHTEPAREFILAVYEKDKEHSYLRAPISYNPDGSITLT